MTKNEIEAKLREMREIRVRAFRDFKNPVLDGEEISWREFEEEQKKTQKNAPRNHENGRRLVLRHTR